MSAKSLPTRFSLLLAASISVAALGAVVAPDPAWAVICSNGGAGADPAGVDGGEATNTACGENASTLGPPDPTAVLGAGVGAVRGGT